MNFKRVVWVVAGLALIAGAVEFTVARGPGCATVQGQCIGRFGADSPVADPKPGPAMISPKLDLAAYSTVTGVLPPASERVTASITIGDGVTMAPSAAPPTLSQQAAVISAAEEGFPTSSLSGQQPKVMYGVLTDSTQRTVATLPAGVSVPKGVTGPASTGLLYQNVPTWMTEYVNVPLEVSGGPPPLPGVTTTSHPAPVGNFYIFVNANTGKYMFAESVGR